MWLWVALTRTALHCNEVGNLIVLPHSRKWLSQPLTESYSRTYTYGVSWGRSHTYAISTNMVPTYVCCTVTSLGTFLFFLIHQNFFHNHWLRAISEHTLVEWFEGATWDSLGFGLENIIGFHQHSLKPNILSGCQSGLEERKILKTLCSLCSLRILRTWACFIYFSQKFSVLWGREISVVRPQYRNFCAP